MSRSRPPASPGEGASRSSVLSVCLDANVWVSYLMAQVHDRGTVITDLVGMIDGSSPAPIPIQLSISHELLDTIERVLLREGVGPGKVAAFLHAVLQIEQTGPLRPGPTFLIAGRDQIAMRDREDAGVLASCIAGRVDVLATDNLTSTTLRFATTPIIEAILGGLGLTEIRWFGDWDRSSLGPNSPEMICVASRP